MGQANKLIQTQKRDAGYTRILLNCIGSVFENFKSLQSHIFHLETFEQLCQSVNNSLIEISHFLKPTVLFATVNWRLLIIERTHQSLVFSAHLSEWYDLFSPLTLRTQYIKVTNLVAEWVLKGSPQRGYKALSPCQTVVQSMAYMDSQKQHLFQ